jgi:hypothetical protein
MHLTQCSARSLPGVGGFFVSLGFHTDERFQGGTCSYEVDGKGHLTVTVGEEIVVPAASLRAVEQACE